MADSLPRPTGMPTSVPRRFQSAELIRLAGSGTGITHRLLQRLAQSGLMKASTEGHQKYYPTAAVKQQ